MLLKTARWGENHSVAAPLENGAAAGPILASTATIKGRDQ